MCTIYREVEVWVPHRISGFFQMMEAKIANKLWEQVSSIYDDEILSKIGSKGGGPALTAYGKTNIHLLDNNQIDEFIQINSKTYNKITKEKAILLMPYNIETKDKNEKSNEKSDKTKKMKYNIKKNSKSNSQKIQNPNSKLIHNNQNLTKSYNFKVKVLIFIDNVLSTEIAKTSWAVLQQMSNYIYNKIEESIKKKKKSTETDTENSKIYSEIDFNLDNNRVDNNNDNVFFLVINHNFDLPPGCGYGTSGAGALGLALSINYLFDLGMSLEKTAKFAHIAEVFNHTGLGTVGGQVRGGLSLSIEPGYPFQMETILVPEDVILLLISFGPISTKEILTDPEYRKIIAEQGNKAMSIVKKKFSFSSFIEACEQFVKKTDLTTRLNLKNLKEILENVKKFNIIGAGMNQLGNSCFIACKKEVAQILKEFIKKTYNPDKCLTTVKICHHGPILKYLY